MEHVQGDMFQPTAYQADLFFDNSNVQKIKDELWSVRHKHFLAQTRREKNELRRQDKELRTKLANLGTEFGFSEESTRLMASWDPYNQNMHAEFLESEWMFNVKDGFDIVIGNPPYVLIDKGDYNARYAKFFKYQSGKIDLYRLFMEKAFCSLASRDGGIVSYITPNTFLAIPSCKSLREFMLQCNTILRIVNFDTDVFDDVSVNSVVFVARAGSPSKQHMIAVSPNGIESSGYSISQFECLENTGSAIRIFQDPQISSILGKMMKSGQTVGDREFDICLGEQPYHNTLHTKQQMEKRFLHADHKVNKSYLQELGGRDIFKYSVSRARQIYLDYSAELYTKPSMRYFDGPRIIVREIPSETLICAYATEKFLVNKSCYVIKIDKAIVSYQAFMGLLNSKLIGFWIANSGEKTKQNLFPRIAMASLRAIPLPDLEDSSIKKIAERVDQILAFKAKDVHADTSDLEAKIDALVYKLYGLTEEEIAVVEQASGSGEKKTKVKGEGEGAKAEKVAEVKPVKTAAKATRAKKPQFAEEF